MPLPTGPVLRAQKIRTCYGANCGCQGCVHCRHRVDDTGDAELDGDWVCGDECEIEWLQSLAQGEDRSHRLYQDWMAKRIQAVRLKKTG